MSHEFKLTEAMPNEKFNLCHKSLHPSQSLPSPFSDIQTTSITARKSGNEKSFFYLEFLPIHYLCLWKLTIMFPIQVFNGHYFSHADFLMTTIPKTETEMSQRH